MKIFSLILPVISTLVWVAFAWVATVLQIGVQQRTVFTDLGQFMGCLGTPLFAILLSVVPSLMLNQTRFAAIGQIWCLLIIALVIPAVFALDGGM